MKKLYYLFTLFITAITVTACVPQYSTYYVLDENYLQQRQVSTRFFETEDEQLIIVSSAQVLQDLGFTIEESEIKLGLLTAHKESEATTEAGKVGLTLLAVLAGTQPVWDEGQKIYITLVTTKSRINEGYNVRIEFAKVSWTNTGIVTSEKINDTTLYAKFFEKLSQSVFLTANEI